MSSPYSNPYASPTSRPTYPGQMPGPQIKPAPITVFGVLHLVFGVIGLCGIGFGVFGLIIIANNPGARMDNPILDHPIGYAWNFASLAMGTITTFIMLAAGVLLLTDKELGRVLTIIYGWLSIAFGAIGMIVMAIVLISIFSDANGGPEQAGAMIGGIAGSCGGIIGMIYPGLAIYFMTRDNVKNYFKRLG
ncbi:MAG: hypothetical protein JNL67_03715 [Planctomycetaceae bacterium]|nr:hypothetical protein [Planctomycetaceae bacterium]